MPPRILDVGQCMVDGPRLERLLKESLGAHVDNAATKADSLAFAAKHTYDLVLVNRILNNDRSPGISVVEALVSAHPKLKVMLVSDLEEAQKEAVAKGALPGFGKSAMLDPATLEKISAAIAPA